MSSPDNYPKISWRSKMSELPFGDSSEFSESTDAYYALTKCIYEEEHGSFEYLSTAELAARTSEMYANFYKSYMSDQKSQSEVELDSLIERYRDLRRETRTDT